ncbi:MAG: alpha/beta hydrolase-fold protein [Actinocatenispora sp.]
MLPWRGEMAGTIDEHEFDSALLWDNPLGDPHRRPLWVYRPPGYGADERRYPVVYVLQGYSGHLAMWNNRSPFRQPFPELADALFARGDTPPVLVVYVDCWTAFGGSQFVDSPGTGRYLSYLCDEVVPWVDANYRTVPDRDHRAITGKSSGGYGAMVLPMLRPEVFGALATHAGDALFDVCYRPMFPRLSRILRDAYGGSIEAFLTDFRSRVPLSKKTDMDLMMLYGVSAAWSAEEDGTVRLPFDSYGRVVPEVWERWLALDPVVMAAEPGYATALRSLRGLWIDAGTEDEFHLDAGAGAFRDAVLAAGVPAGSVYYELFQGGHGAIEYRYPLALAWLARLLTD